jgi:hypothetical protein
MYALSVCTGRQLSLCHLPKHLLGTTSGAALGVDGVTRIRVFRNDIRLSETQREPPMNEDALQDLTPNDCPAYNSNRHGHYNLNTQSKPRHRLGVAGLVVGKK